MKILVLCEESEFANIVCNRLIKEFGNVSVICEEAVDRKTFIKKRIKKLGFWKVFGQILFVLLGVPMLRRTGQNRIKNIIEENNLDISENFKKDSFYKIKSVNSHECRNLIRQISPDIIVVNGTRIISKETITCSNAIMVNMHMGITPKYRGVHGGYWALVNDDEELCGVTIHQIDTGIDTGRIYMQEKIECEEQDNFCTYPYLQVAKGIELEVKAIKSFMEGSLTYSDNDLPSMLWSHPTLWGYLYYRIKRGVK